MIFVGGEVSFGRIEFKEAVNGRGETAGRFGQALGGAAGGGGEMDADFLGAQDIDEGTQNRGLTRSGSTGEDAEFFAEGGADGVGLFGGEFDGGFLLSPIDGGFDFDGREAGTHGGDALHHGGDLGFGAVENGKLDKTGTGERIGCLVRPVADEVTRFEEGRDAVFEVILGGVEELGGVSDEIGFADGGMALFLEGFHRVEEAGVEPGRGVVGETEVDGDLVSGFEADAVDIAGDTVRLGGENGLSLGAVGVVELHALASRDAVGLEENIEFAEGALVVPSGLDGGDAFFADTGNGAEASAFLGEDAKGVGAEGVDDLVGVDLADTGDEPAAEVFADPIHGRREGGLE